MVKGHHLMNNYCSKFVCICVEMGNTGGRDRLTGITLM